jgi:hypothetical protein
MEREKYYITEVTEDLATGELLVKIPEQIINEMDWYEGVELEWTIDGDGALLIQHETTNN